MDDRFPSFDDAEILAARGPKRNVDARRPYAFMAEPELDHQRRLVRVATVFLTNRECPYRCLMCDLWRNTTDAMVSPGAIPGQIDFALSRLPSTRTLKLYNNGNFFDARAIPRGDWEAIAHRLEPFETVIVENHPRLCTPRLLDFKDRIPGRLEIALGLETAHPAALRALNKGMTVDDYRRACDFLLGNGVSVRTFLLLWPPFLDQAEGMEWVLRSVEVARESGSECIALIPLRPGTGLLARLATHFPVETPSLRHLEIALEASLGQGTSRVFVDLWDTELLEGCARCRKTRIARLREMNHTQCIPGPVTCDRCERLPG